MMVIGERMKPFSEKLHGVFVPMITPMDDNQNLDEAGARKFTKWLVEQSVQGVYPCSGCGEVWKLSSAERKTLMDIVIGEAGGKTLVLPGTGAGSTREVIQLNEYAREAGADAVVVWPPYHMGTCYTEDAIFDHYQTIAQAVDIPLVVYDSPEITGYPLSVEETQRLADVDRSVGVKESTGDMHKFARTMSLVGDRIAMLQGWDTLLLGSLILGAPGAVLSSANVCPRHLVDLLEDFEGGNHAAARGKHEQLLAFVGSGPWQLDQFQSMKEILGILGLPGGRIRKPCFSPPFSAQQKDELAASARAMGLL